jgi:hypothetical protein
LSTCRQAKKSRKEPKSQQVFCDLPDVYLVEFGCGITLMFADVIFGLNAFVLLSLEARQHRLGIVCGYSHLSRLSIYPIESLLY